MRILFVCTGNLFRSPIAERLAATWARESLVSSPGPTGVEMTSAGTAATDGRPMASASAQALERLGGTSEGFRSRALTPSRSSARTWCSR